MIAYFDTSSVLPLIIEEPASSTCVRIWDESTRVISVRLLFAEAQAALAQAQRLGRLEPGQLEEANDELDRTVVQIDHVEVTEQLVRVAGRLAQAHALRGYDAVHLAAAQSVADEELVVVTGNKTLAEAAQALRLSVALTG